jgi:NAD(P)-dependent dehydrogenase (short-subunit alcohol dehydrogenase family)
VGGRRAIRIGEVIAHTMAKAGARVIVADIDATGAECTVKTIGGSAAHYHCDVSDRAQCGAVAAAAPLVRPSAGPRAGCTRHRPRTTNKVILVR